MNKKRENILKLDGITKDIMQELGSRSASKYGAKNISAYVRFLIANDLQKETTKANLDISEIEKLDTVRIQITLPKKLLHYIENLAEDRFSSRSYFIKSLLFERAGIYQMQGDQIETLRRSNYEMAKIGTNLNQIAKAFNTIVAMQSNEKPPELGKKITALSRAIKEHTKLVLYALNMGAVNIEKNYKQKTK